MADIAALKDAVVEAAKAAFGLKGDHSMMPLFAAVDALRAAEEAARRPRLMTPEERINVSARENPRHVSRETLQTMLRAIEARDAEWLAAIRGRRHVQHTAHYSGGGQQISMIPHPEGPWVAFADIESLAEGAKR